MNQALDFPFPPTTGAYGAEPPTSPSVAAPVAVPAPPVHTPPAVPAPPAVDELTALREQVVELNQVIALAKTRVETLGAEKREALERALHLQAQLDAAAQREAELQARFASAGPQGMPDETTVADLLLRVAALEAIVTPPRVA